MEVLDQKKRLCNSFFSEHSKGVWFNSLLFLFLLGLTTSGDGKISTLGEEPDWSELDVFQNSCTRSQFLGKLKKIYSPREEWWAPWIQVKKQEARIRKKANSEDWYILKFFEEKKQDEINTLGPSQKKSIRKIALDPGHIGGIYSEMEGRHFFIEGGPVVKEGVLSLRVAQRVKELLEKKGLEVFLVREKEEPVTEKRPADFDSLAKDWLKGLNLEGVPGEEIKKLLTKRKEILFYRVSEIRARARLINEEIRPDLVICLHLNAAPWKNPDQIELVERNDYHLLVNGCYMGGELAFDDQRFELLFRLLNGWDETERVLAEDLSRSFKKKSSLPAFRYHGPNAVKVGSVPGVWGRNLLANRIYRCPVVFLEPYVANSKQVYSRIQMGDYHGHRLIGGRKVLSLVEEYAQAVVAGLPIQIQQAE